jgi:enterochelin esterase family protein
MNYLTGFIHLSSCCIFLALAAAQQNKPAETAPVRPVISPEVHADGSVTFRFRAPNVQKVMLARETAQPIAMQRDDQGLWNVTTEPLPPDYYGYSFIADGVHLLDPSNSLQKPNLLTPENMVHVPGPPSVPWELNDVPHGEVHHHFYHSAVAADHRDFYVYTPPGYDPLGKQSYPTLFLLHGYSDDASGWTAVGMANVILDNLIAQGKAKPMIVVMPLGYGTMEFVSRGENTWSHTELRNRNFAKFGEALLTEVIPQVESRYRVTKDRNARAIAGLSMGGSESLLTGLNHLDQFSWIGAFSSGGIPEDFQSDFPSLDTKANQQLHLLWIACGTDDHLIGINRQLREWLKSKSVHHTVMETPGGHNWTLWRRNLAEFVPLLFR